MSDAVTLFVLKVAFILAVLGLVGFIAGVSMGMTLSQVVVASLHTVFVCFAEVRSSSNYIILLRELTHSTQDPSALSQNHPHEYEALVKGWRKFHGDAFSAAFGAGV